MRENNLIHLKGMEFYAYHGVMEEERVLGQRFIIDVDIFPDTWVDEQERLKDTVNYAQVFNVVQNCVLNERYQLIESLAENIASRILGEFDCKSVRVEVHKPNAPVPGIVKDISVEILREKKI